MSNLELVCKTRTKINTVCSLIYMEKQLYVLCVVKSNARIFFESPYITCASKMALVCEGKNKTLFCVIKL